MGKLGHGREGIQARLTTIEGIIDGWAGMHSAGQGISSSVGDGFAGY